MVKIRLSVGLLLVPSMAKYPKTRLCQISLNILKGDWVILEKWIIS